MKSSIDLKFKVASALILLAAFSRIIPHMSNFSPLGAIALFGAAHFKHKWQAFLIPLAATWLSDLFINNVIYAQYYPSFTWFYQGFYWQYLSYAAIALCGIFLFPKVSKTRVLVGALSATGIFFLISNFGCWLANPIYPNNAGGLTACYAAGIPYLKGTLLGDLFYTAVLFGVFSLAQQKYSQLQEQRA